MPKYILFDTETTGNAEEDRIIQFGAMIIDPKLPLEKYDELCTSDIEIKLEAMEVHNITPDLIENKPLAIETNFYKKLLEYNNNENFLIAHNINFDLGMVEKEGFDCKYKTIDTLRCARHLFPELSHHRLQFLRYALELYKNEEKEAQDNNIIIKAHDAIGDVLVMKIFLSKLLERVQETYPSDSPMDKLADLTQTPVFVKTFRFGKYKGKSTKEVASEDTGYLNWMRKNMDLDEDMAYTLDKLLGNI